jgi:hypothetical protein
VTKFDTPITAACKRMMSLQNTGYLPSAFYADLQTLMNGAMAYEVLTQEVGSGAKKPAPLPSAERP